MRPPFSVARGKVPMPSRSLAGARTAIVTGAARGLGAACAKRLSADGFSVAIVDNNLDGAEAVATSILAKNGSARAFEADVSSGASVAHVFDAIFDWSPHVSVLVSNAAVFGDERILEMKESSWDKMLSVNLKGAFLCGQAFGRHLARTGSFGAIINMSSTAAFSARPGAAHYSVSKAGIVMLTKSMAHEFGPLGIRVVAIAPGLLEIEGDNIPEAYRAAFAANVPMGRVGTVDDITGLVAFLASDEARFITGICVPVDGGMLTGRQVGRTGQSGS